MWRAGIRGDLCFKHGSRVGCLDVNGKQGSIDAKVWHVSNGGQAVWGTRAHAEGHGTQWEMDPLCSLFFICLFRVARFLLVWSNPTKGILFALS